jgi:hypothetical protein
MSVELIYAISALIVLTAMGSYTFGALTSIKDKDARRALADAYRDQELLREQLYLMRVAGSATQGAGSSVATRRSRLKDVD